MILPTRFFLSQADLAFFLSKRDFSDGSQGIHCINLIVEKLKRIFESQKKYNLVEVRRGDKISHVSNEFDPLFYPLNSYIRACEYGRYIDQERLLRTHMTPMAVDIMKGSSFYHSGEYLYILPGICFRRDVIAKNRVNEPHKIDFLILRKGKPLLTLYNLEQEVANFVQSLRTNLSFRSTEVVHPFTKSGLSVEVKTSEDSWLKILECGLASDELLVSCGLNPDCDSAILMGSGLERLVMVAKQIDDMRVLGCKHPKIESQMQDLNPFSAPFRSKLFSECVDMTVPKDWSLVDVSECLRCKMGDFVSDIESLEIVEESPTWNNLQKMKLKVIISSVEKELTERDVREVITSIKTTDWKK